jgi:hypothetical protein
VEVVLVLVLVVPLDRETSRHMERVGVEQLYAVPGGGERMR